MVGERKRFDWHLFFKHTGGGLLIATIWIAQAIARGNPKEIGFVFLLGFIIVPVVGYVWTRRSSKPS